ncbi:MAG: ABC transporter permease [Pseudomonadota bacterium]
MSDARITGSGTASATATASRRGFVEGLLANRLIVLIVLLAVLCVAISIGSSNFYSVENIVSILRQSSMVLIVAIGMTLLLISGEVDLSVGASMAFTGAVAMSVMNATSSLLLGILAGLAFAGGVGLFNGVVVTFLRVNSLIATIATLMILQGGVFIYTREAVQNHHQIPTFPELGAGYVLGLPVPVVVAAVCFIVAWVALAKTTFGRRLFAVGGNPKAARLSGLRATRLKIAAFVITGLLVGVTGLILASLMNAGQPTAGRGFELIVVASVILGGTSLYGGEGTLLGTFLGVLILKVIDNAIIILGLNQDLQIVVPGVVIIIAVYLDQVRKKRHAT